MANWVDDDVMERICSFRDALEADYGLKVTWQQAGNALLREALGLVDPIPVHMPCRSPIQAELPGPRE